MDLFLLFKFNLGVSNKMAVHIWVLAKAGHYWLSNQENAQIRKLKLKIITKTEIELQADRYLSFQYARLVNKPSYTNVFTIQQDFIYPVAGLLYCYVKP